MRHPGSAPPAASPCPTASWKFDGRSREILQAPKVYGFDTGFVCHYRGLEQLADRDLGPLWEHLVRREVTGPAVREGAP